MSSYHLLNIVGHLATFFLFGILYLTLAKSRLRIIGSALIAWITGLLILQKAGQIEALRLMRSATSTDHTSEEFLMSIPDGPNISAGWIITGWIPLLLAWLIAKKIKGKGKISMKD